MMAWEERKQRRFVGVKINWSIATRVRIVALEEGFPLIMIRRWRKENQVVAAGPKIARSRVVSLGFLVWEEGRQRTAAVESHSACSF
jgi:hypothetical protein